MIRILFYVLWALALSGPGAAQSNIAPDRDPENVAPDRDAFLALARQGWVYELRTAMWRPDPLIPPIVINGRDLAGATLCILGEAPHVRTKATLDTFRALMANVFAEPLPVRQMAADAGPRDCGAGRVVYIRLYSDNSPHTALNSDLRQMDELYVFGLPGDRDQPVISPAQAQTFFGRRGRATHILVKQPAPGDPDPLQAAFYSSILIEELYQTFTFGMDILHFDPDKPFLSKLEEYPVNLRHLPWSSARYMEALLASNPTGLCRFDVFMLHALAGADVKRTNSDDFLTYIDTDFDVLMARTAQTLAQPAYDAILDRDCARD